MNTKADICPKENELYENMALKIGLIMSVLHNKP